MGNVNLPTPVALAGGAICILGGYLLGVVVSPNAPSQTTGVVDSYDGSTDALCLSGDSIEDQEGATATGQVCGTWRQTEGSSATPEPGDQFRFVSMVVDASRAGETGDVRPVTVIYGEVVP